MHIKKKSYDNFTYNIMDSEMTTQEWKTITDSPMKMPSQCLVTMLKMLRKGKENKRENIIPLYKFIVHLYTKHYVQFWLPFSKRT